MEVKAVSRYVRISPQKVRMLVGAVKGRRAEDGFEYATNLCRRRRHISLKKLYEAL